MDLVWSSSRIVIVPDLVLCPISSITSISLTSVGSSKLNIGFMIVGVGFW